MSTRSSIDVFFLPALLIATLLAACAARDVADEPAAGDTSATEVIEPRGDWRVARLGNRTLAADGAPTLSFFEPGRAGGHAGCNRYSATWELDRNGRLVFGPAMATKMACADAARMQAEIDFLSTLAAVRGYRHAGDNLHLVDEAGTVLVELVPATAR